MKRLKIMMLVLGMTTLMAGCTPTGQQGQNILGDPSQMTASGDENTDADNTAAAEVVVENNEANGAAEDEAMAEEVESSDAAKEESTENAEASETAADTEAPGGQENSESTEAQIEAAEGTIQYEMAEIEVKSAEIEKKSWDDLAQQEMNQLTYEWYELWDAELNSLWSRIVEKVTPEKKEELLNEQRAWIKKKEANIKAAGAEAEGGTLQPQLENGTAMRYTRKRCYELAEILAKELGESFAVPEAVEQSLVDVDPTLDHVFEKFEGQWIFDKDRGAVIGVERSETQGDFAPEGSKWTVWATGGDVISDLDVIDYTDETITFCVDHDSYKAYYMLRFNMEYSVQLAYGRSLDAMDDVITAD